MSISFAPSTLTLANWGFSAGDIATLAGAGRAAITWVTNSVKDRNLLEFMKIDIEDLIPRRGIIDPVGLHNRWDVRMSLFQNGAVRVIEGPSGPLIESMNIFSWFMTIVTTAMDATLQMNSVRAGVSGFLTALFEEHVDQLDYLQRELPQHIQGWISAGIVRNIRQHARRVWSQHLDRKLRLPGNIPKEDVVEIIRFLVWLAGAKNQKESKKFETASSDIFAFASILKSIGLDAIDTITENEEDTDVLESSLVVKYTPTAISTGISYQKMGQHDQSHRLGMRIPLQCMVECISVWPGTPDQNNQRRLIFEDGLAASKKLFAASLPKPRAEQEREHFKQPCYMLWDETHEQVTRTDPVGYRIASECFPVPTQTIIRGISKILKNSGLRDSDKRGVFRELEEDSETLSMIQIYALGYYYGLLTKFLDVSKLSTPEAYGTWKWFDNGLIRWFRTIVSDHSTTRAPAFARVPQGRVSYFQRTGILKLAGLLFSGAEHDRIRQLDESAIGLHGKTSVMTNSLLGTINFINPVMDFTLLDTDPMAIPSNIQGIITSGVANQNTCEPQMLGADALQNIKDIEQCPAEEDFTSHIEPDWDNDLQQCQVVFRYRGRVVGRIAPSIMERARTACELRGYAHISSDTAPSSGMFYVARIEDLVLNCPQPDFMGEEFHRDQPAILVPTQNLVKLKTFLLAHYSMTGYFHIKLDIPWLGLGWTPEQTHTNNSSSWVILYADANPDDTLHTGKAIILA